jgi:hypothetical protein
MRLRYDPFPLVFAQGSEATKITCLDFFGLTDSLRTRECLLSLIKQQRSDGSFPSGLDSETWGMQETTRHVLLLLKVGLPPDGVNAASAATFILNHRSADGGWCENPALKLPPERTWLNNERSITWLTADVVGLLRHVGLGESGICRSALEWLRTM